MLAEIGGRLYLGTASCSCRAQLHVCCLLGHAILGVFTFNSTTCLFHTERACLTSCVRSAQVLSAETIFAGCCPQSRANSMLLWASRLVIMIQHPGPLLLLAARLEACNCKECSIPYCYTLLDALSAKAEVCNKYMVIPPIHTSCENTQVTHGLCALMSRCLPSSLSC